MKKISEQEISYWKQCGLDPKHLSARICLYRISRRDNTRRDIVVYPLLRTITRLSTKEIKKELRRLPMILGTFSLEQAKKFQKDLHGSLMQATLELVDFDAEGVLRAAKDPNTPNRLLEILSLVPSVQDIVAKNPNTPIKTLLQLAKHFPTEVFENPIWALSQVENPNLLSSFSLGDLRFLSQDNVPIHILKQAVKHPDYLVRTFPLESSKCPESIIQILARDQDKRVRRLVAAHKRCPPSLLKDFLLETAPRIRKKASENPNCPKELIKLLRKAGATKDLLRIKNNRTSVLTREEIEFLIEQGGFAKELVVQCKECPFDILTTLSKDPSPLIRSRIVSRPDCSLSLLSEMAKDEIAGVRIEVARHQNCSPELFTALSKDLSFGIRESVAKHPNCPEDILLMLAKDHEARVQAAVAWHPNCPKEAFYDLFIAKNSQFIHQSLVKHPNCPDKILQRFASGQKFYLRKQALLHSNFPKSYVDLLIRAGATKNLQTIKKVKQPALVSLEELQELSTHGDFAKEIVANHPNCPEGILETLALHLSILVRNAVAQNINCRPETLNILAQDKNWEVQENARQNPNFKKAIVE